MVQKPVLQTVAERWASPKFWKSCGTALLAAAAEEGLLDAAAYPSAEDALLERLRGLRDEGAGL